MAITKEVINTLRSRSIIRVVNDTVANVRINLAELAGYRDWETDRKSGV